MLLLCELRRRAHAARERREKSRHLALLPLSGCVFFLAFFFGSDPSTSESEYLGRVKVPAGLLCRGFGDCADECAPLFAVLPLCAIAEYANVNRGTFGCRRQSAKVKLHTRRMILGTADEASSVLGRFKKTFSPQTSSPHHHSPS
jgi:hypothetical protein